MCGEQLNYKSYQNVINLGCDKKTKVKKEPKPTVSKRRTKTGCMTCRRRKKKCDEHKTGGKCQACIRNFLDCHWPGEETTIPQTSEAVTPESPKIGTKFVPESPKPLKGADAYPSPVMSPKSESAESSTSCMDIKSLTLPPIQEKVAKVSKVTKPRAKQTTKKMQGAQFFITSFDAGKALCQIKS